MEQGNVLTEGRGEEIILTLLRTLPNIRRQIETDLEAAYAGDPAARSIDEVILCYPAFTGSKLPSSRTSTLGTVTE